MKKVKRKYTRKVVPDAPESISTPVQEERSIVDRATGEVIVKHDGSFSFNDLPLSIRAGVERTIKYRERLKLPDDSKERKELAVRMFRGDRPR
jgi:hypothetical protein